MRPTLASAALATLFVVHLPAQTPAPAQPHHDGNFDAERKQANDLFLAQRPLEALPLYEDLCRQDPTIAVFAERHGAGLLAKEATISDPKARLQVHMEAIKEIQRAQSLGDNSPYVRTVLNAQSRTLVGSSISGFPLSIGYTYHGAPAAQQPFKDAEAAFGHSDWTGAAKLYEQAAAADPNWYDAALYAGDMYFRLKDPANAGQWFAKAIAIDPDRETAYRYWGDALFQSGDRDGGRDKFVQAVVAEPYTTATISELGQWAQRTGHQIIRPAITRPEFTTTNGVLNIDSSLAASTADGRSSWILYQQYRVAHGALTLGQFMVAGGWDTNGVVHPKGYRHTINEEHEALRAMLADIEAKLSAGTLTEPSLDPSIRNIRALEKANALDAWIAVNAADAGIRSDYPEFRAHNRKHIADYINTYLIR